MVGKETEGFKIDLEDSNEQAGSDEMIPDAGIAGLRRSPSIAIVLIFLALFAFIFFVYLNLGTRINAITKAGETRIKTVSTGVGDRLDGISKKLDNLKKNLRKKTDALESSFKKDSSDIRKLSKKTTSLQKTADSLVAIKKRLSQLASSIKKIETKADKDTIRIDKRLSALDSAIKELKTSFNAISAQQDRIKELSTRIDAFSQTIIDKEQMSAAIDALKKEISRRIDRADTLHASELSKIRSELAGINKAVSTLKRPAIKTPAPVTSKNPDPEPITSGRIIEQEIK